MDRVPQPHDREPRFARIAWILLDWAASGFSTVLITLVVAYFEKLVFADGDRGVPAGVVWAWTMAAAMLASAVVAPWAAAWADRRDAHQRALVAGTLVGAGGLCLLAVAPPSARTGVVAATIAACVGFDVAQVFTGSLLPRLAGERDADRLSAWGFAAGYAGGAIALLVATAVVTSRDRLGLDAAGGLRLAFGLTAVWWVVFSAPAAVARFGGGSGVADAGAGSGVEGGARAGAGGSAGGTLGDLVAWVRPGKAAAGGVEFAAVLGGAVLALGAVQTAIAQFSSLAIERFDLDGPALVRLVLLVQAVALPGALAAGWLAERHGRRIAAAVCLGGWVAVLVLAWFVRTPGELHLLAVLLALVLGGVQSLLRAVVAARAPAGRSGATFGALQVGTKLSGFTASLLFGGLALATGEPRAGLVALLVQIAAGWWLLRRVS